MIILTSFEKLHEYKDKGKVYSVSVNNEQGIERLDFLLPVDEKGNPIEKDIDITNKKAVWTYVSDILHAYAKRWNAIQRWLDSLKGDIVLVCQCPYDDISEKQLRETGEFLCHSGIIGILAQKYKCIPVVLDEDREVALLKSLKPLPEKCLLCEINEWEVECSWSRFCAGPYKVNSKTGRITSLDPEFADLILKEGSYELRNFK